MKRYFWLAGLAAVFSVTSVFSKGWISGFTSNLGAGFVASLLIVFLIDRAIEPAQQQQSRRVRSAAFKRLRPKLVSHLTFLFNLHKASALEPPAAVPSRLDELFTEAYYESVRHLDFSRPAPVCQPMNWFAYCDHNVREFANSLERMLDTYVAFLEPESIEALEDLQNSTVATLFSQLAFLEQRERFEGRGVSPLVLSHDSMIEVLRRYIARMIDLVAQFNQYARIPIGVSDVSLWRNDISPAVGSARISD